MASVTICLSYGQDALNKFKLPSNASKERSATYAELRHRAEQLDKATDKILVLLPKPKTSPAQTMH